MCGIFGFSHLTPTTRAMAPFLAWEMEDRGHDSWGATNGTDVVKVMGPITDSYAYHMDEINAWDRAIYHTRASSQGSVCVENQHPFTFSKSDAAGKWQRTLIGIHNGIVSNHYQLNQKYGRGFAVDTMHIYKHLTDRIPTGEIQGYGNLAWYEMNPTTPEGVLYLMRFNSDNLHVARMGTDELVFCSTKDPIERAAAMAGTNIRTFFKLEEEHPYYIRFEKDRPVLFKSTVRIPFGTRTTYQGCGTPTAWEQMSRRSTNSTRRRDMLEGLCAVVGCSKKVEDSRKSRLICHDHWMEVLASTTPLTTEVYNGG
jgi:hypothetical protein